MSFLDKRLAGIVVHDLDTPEGVLEELRRGDCDLLILNHSLSGAPAMEILSRVRADPRWVKLPILYALDRKLDSKVGRQLLEQLGVQNPLLHPVDQEVLAQRASVSLNLPLRNEDTHAAGGRTEGDLGDFGAEIPLEQGNGPSDHPLLLVVGDDPSPGDLIVAEALARGIRAELVGTENAARAVLERERPDVVLIDLAFPSSGDEGLALLKEMNRQDPPVPVLVTAASDTFLDRVQVASLGGRGFLQKSLPASEILDAVTRLLQQMRAGQSRVLVVDNDAEVLAELRGLLEPEGIALTTLEDPLGFWDTLEQTAPDLLMVDLDMPRLSGIELCRVVRNDARWSALPVLFLTEGSDPETVRRVFAAGADDFVSKPIVGPELVTKVVNRLERTLLYRSMADIDPMTGVTNRRKSTQTLRQFLRLAERQNQPLSFALLDVDYFKQINDRFGHGTGDAILQQFGQVLMRTFRSEDVVARWGGEEFLIGMYGMSRLDGVQRLTDLLEDLHRDAFTGPHAEQIRITFSAGVAQFPDDGADVQTLYRAADGALYRAKETGRDRVIPVGQQVEGYNRQVETVDVVLVERDEVLGEYLVQALQRRDYRCQWFKDGETAAFALAGLEPSVRAHVVVIDTDLPLLDGLSVVRRLARDGILRQTRVVVLSNSPGDRASSRAIEFGAFDYVAHPFTLPVLLQRVHRAMEIL
ncbi:MAG: response regulator [Chloroflexota bacterium]